MDNAIADALEQWCKDHLRGILRPQLVNRGQTGIHLDIVDEQNPFTRSAQRIAQIRIEGATAVVCSWHRRYEHNHPDSRELTVNLADPDSLDQVFEEIFQIALDYCRLLYRRAIKTKRKHLKPIINEMADVFRKERQKYLLLEKE